MSTSFCSKCKETLPVEKFAYYEGRYNKCQPYCKECASKYRKQLNAAKKKSIPPVTDCRVCGASKDEYTMKYDHNHTTGEFRGWLCHRCNLALGMMEDDVDRLQAAIHYLNETTN